MLGEGCERGVRDRPHADLQAVAIADPAGDFRADGAGGGVVGGGRLRAGRAVDRHRVFHGIQRYCRTAGQHRQGSVDFGDDPSGAGQHRRGEIHPQAEGAAATGVRRGELQHGDIEGFPLQPVVDGAILQRHQAHAACGIKRPQPRGEHAGQQSRVGMDGGEGCRAGARKDRAHIGYAGTGFRLRSQCPAQAAGFRRTAGHEYPDSGAQQPGHFLGADPARHGRDRRRVTDQGFRCPWSPSMAVIARRGRTSGRDRRRGEHKGR